MIKKVLKFGIVLCCLLTVFGCTKAEEQEEPRQTIVAMQMFTNYAWAFSKYAIWIDCDGKVWYRQFSEDQVLDLFEQDIFNKYIFNVNPNEDADISEIGTIEAKNLDKLYKLGKRVNAETEFVENEKMADYGAKVYYYVDANNQLVPTGVYGDISQTAKDENTKKFKEELARILESLD